MIRFKITIEGDNGGNIEWRTSFGNVVYPPITNLQKSDADAEQIINIAKELKNSLAKLQNNLGQERSLTD